MSHEDRKGILYSAICALCGHCIDDHIDPERYGITEEMRKENRIGYRRSLYNCGGFTIRKVNLKNIILVSAKRLYFGEHIPEEFLKYPGVKSTSKKLSKENEEKWNAEERTKYPMNNGSILLVVPGQCIIDMGL